MARKTDIRFRRSATQGAIPTTSQLNLGELALNTYDGKLYMKKDVGGTESIVEIGASGQQLASTFIAYEYTATGNQTTFSGSDNNSNTLAYVTGTPPKVQVFLNGVLLDEGSTNDYTATNGTSVVLTTGAAANDVLQIHAYNSSVNITSNLDLDDNQRIRFGEAQDLQIYHDGSNSYINETGTGDLIIKGGNDILFQDAVGNTLMNMNQSDSVELFYGNNKKLETSSTGITVTGNITSASALSTNVTGDYVVDASGNITLDADGGTIFLRDGGTTFAQITQLIGGLAIAGGSTANDYAQLISGSKNMFFKDITLGDNKKIIFGDGSGNMELYHDASNSYVEDTSDGNLILKTNGDSVKMMAGSENMVIATKDGSVELYHDNSKKIETTASGVQVTGSVAATVAGYFPIVYGGSASLQLKSNTAAMFAQFTNGGAAELYHNNAKKLNTKADGVLITGELEASSLDINGASVLTTNNVSEVLTLVRDNATSNQLGISFSDGTNTRFFGKGTDNELYLSNSANISTGSKIVTAGNFTGILNSTYYQANDNISVGTVSAGNITTSGYLRGPSTFTIDPASYGDNTGTVVIAGDLQVDGTTTTINSTTLTVDDLNLTLASGAANSSAANGAGITIDGASASLQWNHGNQQFRFDKDVFTPSSFVIGTTSTNVGRMYNSSGVMALEAYSTRSISFGNATNGEHVRIDADGNVGIGTQSMTYPLEVHGNTTSSHRVRIVNAANGQSSVDLKTSQQETRLIANSGNAFYVYNQSQSTQPFTIKSNGNVGINVTNPTTGKLVIGGSANQYGLRIDASTTSGQSFGARIRAGTSSSDFGLLVENTSAAGILAVRGDGRVGIGTNAPAGKLHISGNSDLGDEDCMLIIDDVDGSSGSRIPAIMFRSNTGGTVTNQGRIRGTGHSGMVLSGSSALGNDLVVQSSGVGIGTNSPSTNLHVQGSNSAILRVDAQDGGSAPAMTSRIQLYGYEGRGAGIKIRDSVNSASSPNSREWFVGSGYAYGGFNIGYAGNGSQSEYSAQAKFAIDTSGNVGIGTVSPQGKFQVYTSAARYQAFRGNADLEIVSDNNTNPVALIKGTGSADLLNVLDNTTEVFTILDGGNVGIGASSPSQKLDVRGGNVMLGGFGGGTDYGLLLTPADSATYWHIYNDTGGELVFGRNLTIGSNEHARFDNNGNFGIGTNNPSFKLHVKGAASAYSDGGNIIGVFESVTDHATYLKVKNINTNTSASAPRAGVDLDVPNHQTGSGARARAQFVVRSIASSGSGGDASITVPKDLRFFVNNKGTLDASSGEQASSSLVAGTEAMRITDGGYVGIGSQNPQYKLHVDSSTSDWPIYAKSSDTKAGIVIADNNTVNYLVSKSFTLSLGNQADLHASNLNIKSTGHVGIGTTSPVTNLDITAAGVNGIMMNQDTNNSATSARLMFKDSTRTNLLINVNGRLEFRTDATVNNTSGTYRMGVTPTVVDLDVPLQIKTAHIDTYAVNTSSTSAAQVDTFSASSFRSARFTVQITNTTDSTYQVTEILLIHDGTTPAITEYGTIFTGSAREATFDADIVSGNVRLLATPASSDSMQFRVTRHSISV